MPPDPNDLRDPRLDAAWRAASREEPPAALDDAIRAAARRGVGAARSRADAARVCRPSRCARSVGGCRSPPPRPSARSPSASCSSRAGTVRRRRDKAVVSDMPAGARGVRTRSVPTAPSRPQRSSRSTRKASRRAGADPDASAAPRAARENTGPAARPCARALRKDAAVPFPRNKAPQSPTPRRRSPPSGGRRRMTRSRAAREPFPANTIKNEAKESATRNAAPAPPAPPATSRRRSLGGGRRRRRAAQVVARTPPMRPRSPRPPPPRTRRHVRAACESAAEARGPRLDRADPQAARRRQDGRGGERARRVPRRVSRSRAAAAARSARLEAARAKLRRPASFASRERHWISCVRGQRHPGPPVRGRRRARSCAIPANAGAISISKPGSSLRIGAGSAAASASSRVSHKSPGDSARGGHERTATRCGQIVSR